MSEKTRTVTCMIGELTIIISWKNCTYFMFYTNLLSCYETILHAVCFKPFWYHLIKELCMLNALHHAVIILWMIITLSHETIEHDVCFTPFPLMNVQSTLENIEFMDEKYNGNRTIPRYFPESSILTHEIICANPYHLPLAYHRAPHSCFTWTTTQIYLALLNTASQAIHQMSTSYEIMNWQKSMNG